MPAPDVALAHRPGVELVNTGSWELLSGSWQPNRKDILAAVESAQCPAVRRPKLKLGHIDPRFNAPEEPEFDGTPSLGWFDNLRASDDGETLIGDQVALPWLSQVQAAAWPDRSIEGKKNIRCALGHTHPFVVTAVSLLGETPPGIPTLKSIKSIDDLPAALGVAASGEDTEGGEEVQATVRASAEHPFDEAKHKRDGGGKFADEASGKVEHAAKDAQRADSAGHGSAPHSASAARKVRVRDADGKPVFLEFSDGGMSLRIPYDQDENDTDKHVSGHFDALSLDRSATTEFADELATISEDRDAYVKRAKAADDRLNKITDSSSAEYKQAQDAWFELGGDGQRIIGGELPGDKGTLVYEMRMGTDVADTQLWIGLRPPDAGDDWDLQEAASDGPGGVLSMSAFRRLRKEVDASSEVSAAAAPVADPAEAEPVHTGAMVALIPTAEDAARLAVEGGEPAGELHVTLAYLGEAASLGAQGQQDVIDAVSSAVNGMPVIEADIFSVNVFNPASGSAPPDARDRDTCLVWGLSGDELDTVHDLIDSALAVVGTPDQHRPWCAHMTAEYTDDLSQIPALAERVGPVIFDRVRLAFGDVVIDIPLIELPDTADLPDYSADGFVLAAAAIEDDDQLKIFWLGKGLKRWATDPHPWRKLYSLLLPKTKDPKKTKRIVSAWYRDHFGHMPNQAAVKASGTPSVLDRMDSLGLLDPDDPSPDLPAAEPEQPITEPKEDPVSTELSALRSRLGLEDSADLDAIAAAVDELKAKADTPPAPTEEMVAASAAATAEADRAKAAQELMNEELTKVRDELNVIKASAASTVKASFFGGLLTAGKLKPADRETWESRYDRDPEMVTDILSGRSDGSEVPVMASGTAGPAEPQVDDEFEALTARIDSPAGKVA